MKGLLVSANSIRTPYSYEQCGLYGSDASGNSFCSAYISIEVDSAPLVPPFIYNYQCASVLLTSYIPVFILDLSMQLLLPCTAFGLLSFFNYHSMPRHFRNMFHGLIWPEFWLNKEGLVLDRHNECLLQKDPWMILDTRTIICCDFLQNLMLMITFGLCSPVLSVLITCVVVLKMHLWKVLIGRFTKCLDVQRDNIIVDDANVEVGSVSSCINKDKPPLEDRRVHFALVALSEVYISVRLNSSRGVYALSPVFIQCQ